jgi:hypothetical protein
MLKGKEVETVVFTVINDIVQKEVDRIQSDIEDLEDGEVLPFEEACRQETVNQLAILCDNLESDYTQQTFQKVGQLSPMMELLDELLTEVVEDLIAVIEEINPQIDFDEVNNEVAEACQEDGEDMAVVESSLDDLEDATNLPIAEASMIITLEQVILFLVAINFISDESNSVSAMQKLNAMTD